MEAPRIVITPGIIGVDQRLSFNTGSSDLNSGVDTRLSFDTGSSDLNDDIIGVDQRLSFDTGSSNLNAGESTISTPLPISVTERTLPENQLAEEDLELPALGRNEVQQASESVTHGADG